ncbi:unnamed protein product [Linum trigynum]|uniref:Uncharacterized protein n=1 Tax=Linum trigynum TaxID=586398 RepID=A0AAV2DCY7_9ROSI
MSPSCSSPRRTSSCRDVFSTKYDSPLALAILNEPYPGNIHIPNLPEYNGTTALEDHLSCFEILTSLIGASDATISRIFPTTLGGDARL